MLNELQGYRLELWAKVNGLLITTPKGNSFMMNLPDGTDEKGIREAVKKSHYTMAEAYQEFVDQNQPDDKIGYNRAVEKYQDYKDMKLALAEE